MQISPCTSGPRACLLSAAIAGFLVWPRPVFAAEAKAPCDWKAGAANAIITPDEPMVLSGFANRNVPAEGTAMDLRVKALALVDQGGTRFVLVTYDLVDIPIQLRRAVEKDCLEKFNLSAASLMLNCSHTHCGPELRFTEREMAEFDPERVTRCKRYNAALIEKTVTAIGTAIGKLAPARLTWSHARAGFAMNRRTKNPSRIGEPYLNHPNPDGPVDHDVPVLRVEGEDGFLRVIVFGYACHNTTLSIKRFHADYAGHAQEIIEKTHPGTQAMFVIGCAGDQNAYPRFAEEHSRLHGQSLAIAVEAALTTDQRAVHGPLRAAYDMVRLPLATAPTRGEIEARLKANADGMPQSNKYQREYDQRLLRELDRGGNFAGHYDAPLQTVRFGGDLTLVALSGEPVVDYSLRLKRELAGDAAVWIAGYSNEVHNYVPSRRVALEGGYEGGRATIYGSNPLLPAPFAPEVEEVVVAKVHELLKR